MTSVESPTRTAVQPVDDAAPPRPSGAVAAAGRETPVRTLVTPDRPTGDDELGRAPDAAFLAEVVTHRQAETPFCLGLFGADGSGKSFFLEQVMQAVAAISAGAAAVGEASPFLSDVLVVRVDASRDGDPGACLADAVFAGLALPWPALAAELSHAGADPLEAAHEAAARLDDARRRLDTERQGLEALGGREARLVEGVLETPGSRVDGYARANRSRIERALRQFGFSVADPVGTYKDLVREGAESDGWAGRLGLGLRALWAYQGQGRLLGLAVLFALLAWALRLAQANQQSWIGSLRETGDKAGPVADWAQAHLFWLTPLHTGALLVALAALAWAAVRAARFLQPILKGVSLLRHDLDQRRRDIKGHLAHQTRRVDGLTAEVEAAAQHAAKAERRAGARPLAGSNPPKRSGSPTPTETARALAVAFFRDLEAAMTAPAEADPLPVPRVDGPAAGTVPRRSAPRRIVVAVDGLDRRPSEAAARFLDAARDLLGAGVVTVAAAGHAHLAAGFAETDPAFALAQIARCVQLAYRVDGVGGTEAARTAYAARLLEGTPSPRRNPAEGIDPRRSSLDSPWRPREVQTVAALSAFAGDTPRAVKHFVNVYRVARGDPHLRDAPPPVFTALALALALDAHGFPDDLAALERASHGEPASESTVLRRALAVAREASGEPVELGQAQRGLDVARRYTTRT